MTVYLKSFPFYFGQMLSCSFRFQIIDGILQGNAACTRDENAENFKQFKIKFDVLVIKKLFVIHIIILTLDWNFLSEDVEFILKTSGFWEK